MNEQDTMLKEASGFSENHSVIIDDQLYEVDVALLRTITEKLEAVSKPRKVKVRVFTGRQWSESELALLGKDKDDVVARKVGVSTSAVAAKRRELYIPPFRPPGNPSQRVWSDEELSLLGNASDSDIAARLKVSITTVGNKRRALGISRYSKPERDWSAEEIALLGTVPDKILAKQLGLPNHLVYFKRKSLNITAFNRTVHEDEGPREVPVISIEEEALASQIYDIYDQAKTIIKAVAKIKKETKRQDPQALKNAGAYLAAKYQDNFPLERCLTLVGIY